MKIDLDKIFLFFLPFAQALTINLIFPLKISEILLMCIILFYINKKIVSAPSVYFLKQNKIIIAFAAVVTLSFVVNIPWNYDYAPKLVPHRISRIGDSFIRLCYFYLCLAAYFISYRIFTKNINYLNIWIYGAIIAALYGWYLFISSALHIPYFKLPGMDAYPQDLYGIVRCGTFKEGNYFGAFILLSATIAFYQKKNKTAWFLLFTIITSLSTVSIVCTFLFLIYYYRKRFVTIEFLKITPLLILVFIIISGTDYFRVYVYGKIFDPVTKVTEGNFSKIERTVTAKIAYNAGLDNPILGIGPANYALHYDRYNEYKKIIKQKPDWIYSSMKRYNMRAIANNVYFEIWAEYGIIGFFIFVAFLLSVLFKMYKIQEDAIAGGILALIINLFAFPSFIMLFVWVYFAIPFALAWKRKHNEWYSKPFCANV